MTCEKKKEKCFSVYILCIRLPINVDCLPNLKVMMVQSYLILHL